MKRIASVALVLATMATGAAASASPVQSHAAGRATAAHHTRHADAVAEAKRLLRLSPTNSTESRVTAAPRKTLRQPPEAPAESQLVTRKRFWTGSQPLKATFLALTADIPPGMSSAGSGESGKIGHAPSERFADFSVDDPPKTISSADLIIEVIHDGNGHSAIGAYAEVAPQPRRPTAEHVPLSVRTVRLLKLKGFPSHVVKRLTVHGNVAATLVRDFDALVVSPPGETSCPSGGGTSWRAVFRAHGNTWRTTYPSCVFVSVTRDRHSLPDLVPDKAFTHALRAALR
jgi:hypothetical protein